MRWKLAAVGGWVVAGVVVLAGAGGPGEVRTRRLVVEDARGRPFFVVEDADGSKGMTITDPDGGKAVVSLAVGRKGFPSLRVVYPDGGAEQVTTGPPAVRLPH